MEELADIPPAFVDIPSQTPSACETSCSPLERVREQVEADIVMPLVGQVPPIFQDFVITIMKVAYLDF